MMDREPLSIDHVRAAIGLAANHAAAWRATSLEQRGQSLVRLIGRLAADAHHLAPLIARDTGKPIRFCRIEVARTIEMLRAILARGNQARDEVSPVATVRHRPHGVVAVITPFNNPVYLPIGKIAPAVLFGNTVVWKPAPEATEASRRLRDLQRQAGWPEGLCSLLEGDRREGQALLDDPRIDAVSITGSSAAGESAQAACARRRIPLQAELGGNNAAIVWRDADLGDAAAQVAAGAFDAAGQRCTANRRVIVHAAIRENFLNLLIKATRELAWGDPLHEATRIGPLAAPARRNAVAAMIERVAADLGPLIWPLGRELPAIELWRNRLHPPVIIPCDDPRHEIVQEETFGPVLVMQTAGSWEEAIALCNGVRQGLAAAVFTRSMDIADRFLDEAKAGILKLNHSTADAAVDVPFVGWKASGVGPPEHGAFDRDFYTRPQTVYGMQAGDRH